MSYGTGLPGAAGRLANARRSRCLFHWRAEDASADALTGQVGVFERAGKGGVILGPDGRAADQYGQAKPRFSMFDLDGDGWRETRALLNEGGNSNSLLYSEQFGNASGWNQTRVTVLSDTARTLSPRGDQTADKIVEDNTASSDHYVSTFTSPTITAGEYVYLSLFVKAAERSRMQIQCSNSTDRIIGDFNLLTGASSSAVQGTSVITGVGMEYVGDGWWEVFLAGKINAAGTNCTVSLVLHNGTSSSYSGDGVSGLYMWGGQLVRCGTTGPMSYTYLGPNVGSSLTRVLERLNYANTVPAPTAQPDLTIYLRMVRPRWAGWTAIDSPPRVFRMCNSAPGPLVQCYFPQANPGLLSCELNDASTSVTASAAIAAGAAFDACFQIRNILSGGSVRADMGSGFGAWTGTVAPIAAWGNATLALASSGASAPLHTGLICAKLAGGLRTLAEMRELL